MKDCNEINFSLLHTQLKEQLSDRGDKKIIKEVEDKLQIFISVIERMILNMKASDAFNSITDRL